MRLIDADKLLEELRQYHPLSLSHGILSDIEYFPTAYDVDKVIEQFKECSFRDPYGYGDDLIDIGYAIEIVKKGGQNERSVESC